MRGVQWRALGPVEMVVGGRLVDLGPPRQRALFGLLLSRVDRPVAVDVLIDELWSGDPPRAAISSLRAYVSNLRRVLEPDRPARALATVLRTQAPGYLLDSAGVEFDVHRFTGHAAAGRAALGRADPGPAVGDFDAALGLWRGRAYDDVHDAGWAAPEVARLEELRLSVVEGRFAALLELGEHHATVAELEMHVRSHPMREHGCKLLALALYRAGRQAEALRVLRDTRERLTEELGIDLGVALQRLERDILTQAPTLDWHPPGPPRRHEPAPPAAGTVASDPGMATALPGDEPAVWGGRVVSAQVQGYSEVVGREEELAALRAGFTDPQRSPRPVLRVLTGLGGVGKTSLARAYAQRYQDQYGLVWWVQAEDPEAIAGEFRALLGILAPQHAEYIHDPVQAVHAVLANRAGPWLLVVDNIAEPESLRGVLPAAGAGDVLVTSRAGTWPDRRMVLPVQPLAQPHAVHLVTSLSGDADRATAAVLAKELGGLPLALAQAGSYVAHNALDLASYLALYRSRRAELHQEGHAPDYPATVATTWQLVFDRLSPSARALLNLLAWYAPDSIPLDRLLTPDIDHLELPEPAVVDVGALLRPLLVDELHRRRVVTELVAYGLLIRAGPPGCVTVHRLVQAVTADQLTTGDDGGAWVAAAAVLLESACPQPPATVETGIAWQSLHTHVRVLIEHLHPDLPITLRLSGTLADWAGETGEIGRARELAATVVAERLRELGPDHRETLSARIRLAHWTGEAGEVARARELFASVAEDMIRVLGADHPDALRARGTLADWTGKAGDMLRARELSAALAQDEERVLGADDRHTLLARGYLARWTGEAGDVVAARELFVALIEDQERVLGADDRHTLLARAYLARWTGEAGDVVAARELCAALVEDEERVLGPDHRHTLLARTYLARWTGEAGDVARARELSAALVKVGERVLGADHPHTLFARANLARWTGAAGNVERARELAATVIEDCARIYGADHRYTLLVRGWLAPWTYKTFDNDPSG